MEEGQLVSQSIPLVQELEEVSISLALPSKILQSTIITEGVVDVSLKADSPARFYEIGKNVQDQTFELCR